MKTYRPDESGTFKQSGNRYERLVAKSEAIRRRVGDDPRHHSRWEVIETPEYEEGQRYTRKQLSYMADELLRERLSEHPHDEYPAILLPEHYKARLRREIYVESGTPLPEIVSGMYWRTHPQGRKFKSKEQRQASGASFYR